MGVGYDVLRVTQVYSKYFTVLFCLVGSMLLAIAALLLVEALIVRSEKYSVEALEAERRSRTCMGAKLSWCDFLHQHRMRVSVMVFFVSWLAGGVAFGLTGHLDCMEREVLGTN